jgi:hypothetical protein
MSIPGYILVAKWAKQRKIAHRQMMGRMAWVAEYIRNLDRDYDGDDVAFMAEHLGVSVRTIYRYLKNFSDLQVCRTCGRPFAEDRMIKALEEIDAI